ncbi:MAG TPA: FtsQ-type POTRA domain-containing protein, partial [Rhizomicrobium sp.]|nr:FtsQ-type POTRA domain-containing protein [Rhizomicrobium sp.]
MKITRSQARGGNGRATAARKPGRSESRARESSRNYNRRPPPSRFENLKAWFASLFIVRRPMLALTLAMIILAFVGALFIGGYVGNTISRANATSAALVHDAGFGIQEVHIGGNVRTPPETITAVLGFEPGQSIFSADLRTAREKLLHLPWVADATVQRRYPDAITVSLVEKLPYALWRSNDRRVFITERSGGLITDTGVEQFAKLPHLAGDAAPLNAAEIVEAVAPFRAISARLSVYERVSNRRWN